MQKIIAEIKRRNVFRVAGLYTVVGWLLMQVIAVMTPALNLPDWVDSFLALTLIIGFPVAILLAWAFEMTPDGIKPTVTPEGPQSNKTHIGRKIDYFILAGLIAVMGMVGWQITKSRIAPSPNSTLTSIAVLPFIDLSPSSDQEYFSDGLSEELLNLLTKVPDLRVASRTSAFAFKGKDTQISEIADALKVGHVLEGSVRSENCSGICKARSSGEWV